MTKIEQLRSETPGADGFEPADEDIATTPDNGADKVDNGADNELTRLRADNARMLATLGILDEWIAHLCDGRDLDATTDMAELVQETIAIAEGELPT